MHAVVARSSDHFVRRCGAKHISKSKVLKTYGLGALLEVDMSKKCTPLWCEAHFEVKMLKTPHVRTLLDVQMSFHIAGVRDCAKRGRRSILDRWSGKIAKRIGTRPSALHSTFHFLRKSRRTAAFLTLSSSNLRKSRRPVSFLMLSSSKIRKSRSLVSFLTLSSSNTEEVSQNSCVFKLADRQIEK